MKREYFGMLFLGVFVAITLICYYFFNEAIMTEYLSKYIVIWVLLGFYAGQYSMKFPKRF